MTRTIAGHFDGKVIILEEPLKVPVGKRLRIRVEFDKPRNGKKSARPRRIVGTGRFSSGVPDLATNKKHMEGFGRS